VTSKYVQRCLGCRTVRGISSYRVNRNGGGRVQYCQWCEEQAGATERAVKGLRASLQPHLRTHSDLVAKLAATRRTIAAIESEILALEPPQQRTA
jgi:hypothetical protein